MPIMAAQGQNDARGTARLLAIAARDCVSNPTVATEQTVVLNNVYRLLEAYRRNVLPEAEFTSPSIAANRNRSSLPCYLRRNGTCRTFERPSTALLPLPLGIGQVSKRSTS